MFYMCTPLYDTLLYITPLVDHHVSFSHSFSLVNLRSTSVVYLLAQTTRCATPLDVNHVPSCHSFKLGISTFYKRSLPPDTSHSLCLSPCCQLRLFYSDTSQFAQTLTHSFSIKVNHRIGGARRARGTILSERLGMFGKGRRVFYNPPLRFAGRGLTPDLCFIVWISLYR